MYGPTLFLITFILVVPRYREIVEALGNRASIRIEAQSPLSYYVLVIVGIALMLSWMLMAFWPRTKDPERQQVLRRYFGHAGDDRATPRVRAQRVMTTRAASSS